MNPPEQIATQSPAQWAVRWHGVVLAGLLVFSVPVFHLIWHVGLGHEEPPIKTRSQVSMPELRWQSVANGTWMTKVDRHLREASPIVWQLRGAWNEALLRCGVVQGDTVHLGRELWMFQGATVRPDVARFEALANDRRRIFTAVRDLVRAAGAELVVSLVPDKARVHPEFLRDGKMAAPKAPIYGRALQELSDLGITTVDVAAALAVARAVAPAQEFYYRRDTHWRPAGALAAGQAVAAVIEGLPAAVGLSPRLPTELGARTSTLGLGDLVGTLGLLTYEVPLPGDRRQTMPLSLLTADLAETRDNYAAVARVGTATRPLLVEDPGAEILVLGTSFSQTNGAGALALALGRPVRAVIDFGASGLAPVLEALAELRTGTKAKVVVWEIIERGLFEPGWERTRL